MGKKREEVKTEEVKTEEVNACNACDEVNACDEMVVQVVQAAPAIPADVTASVEKVKKITANPTFKLNIERVKVEGEKPLPKQAAQIVDLVAAAGEGGVTREKLLEEMKTVVDTRQPIDRILGFYMPRLVKEGKYLTVS